MSSFAGRGALSVPHAPDELIDTHEHQLQFRAGAYFPLVTSPFDVAAWPTI
jgi:hypothetical protein